MQKNYTYNNELLTEAKITTATKINAYAFYGCLSLTSVTIGDSVTSIGEDAFDGCEKLVEVINKSRLSIYEHSSNNGCVGEYAIKVKESGESEIVNKNGYLFYTDNRYYKKVNYLLGYVGSETNLTLPDSYNGESYEIYEYAFYNCDSITSVTIGSKVTSIGYDAFRGCYRLTSVTFKNPDGWHTYLDGKDVDLTDIVRNAIYLKKFYGIWYKA